MASEEIRKKEMQIPQSLQFIYRLSVSMVSLSSSENPFMSAVLRSEASKESVVTQRFSGQ